MADDFLNFQISDNNTNTNPGTSWGGMGGSWLTSGRFDTSQYPTVDRWQNQSSNQQLPYLTSRSPSVTASQNASNRAYATDVAAYSDTGSPMPTSSVNTISDKGNSSDSFMNIGGSIAGSVTDGFGSVVNSIKSIMEAEGATANQEAQREQFNRTFNEGVRRFDKQFFENMRQFNLNYALNEFSTRKGIAMQEAEQLFKQYWEGKAQAQQEQAVDVKNKAAALDFDQMKRDYDKKLKLAKAFAGGIASSMRK